MEDRSVEHNRLSHAHAVVKLLSKRWWIPIDAWPEGPKLEPEGSIAEVGFPTADLGFSSIKALFGFYCLAFVALK